MFQDVATRHECSFEFDLESYLTESHYGSGLMGPAKKRAQHSTAKIQKAKLARRPLRRNSTVRLNFALTRRPVRIIFNREVEL
jgi:hypothetical protein